MRNYGAAIFLQLIYLFHSYDVSISRCTCVFSPRNRELLLKSRVRASLKAIGRLKQNGTQPFKLYITEKSSSLNYQFVNTTSVHLVARPYNGSKSFVMLDQVFEHLR